MEKRGTPAKFIYYRNGKKIAEFPSLQVIRDKGRYSPTMSFNEDGKSEVVKWKEYDSRLIAKVFPFKKFIMGRNLLCRMIDSSIYIGPEYSFNGFFGKTIKILLAIIVIFMVLVLYWLTPMLPAFITGYLIHYPHLLKQFSNKQLFRFIAIVLTICVYIWIVVLGCRGMVAIFMLFNIVAALLSFKFITFPFLDKIPHDRCPECKEMYKIEEVKTVFWKEYLEYDHEKVKVMDVAKSQKTFRCKTCGMLEYDYKSSYEQVSRKQTGQHTETDTKTETRPYV